MSETPTESAAESSAESAPQFRITVQELGTQRRWVVEGYPGHLALYEPGELQPFVFPRNELGRKLELSPRPPLMVMNHPRKILFQFTDAQHIARLNAWLGAPSYEQMVELLKKRYAWVFPVAALFMISSIPMGGDEAAGRKAVPFDTFRFTLGVVLVVMGFMRRWRPHRVLFLMDAMWFALLACHQLWRIAQGDSMWWFVLVVFEVWLVVGGLDLYRAFARTPMPGQRKAG